MGILSFLSGKNPAKAAMPYLEPIGPQSRAAYNPYIQRGNEANEKAYSAFSSMLEDPQAFFERIHAGYSPSAGYNRQKDLLTQDLRNTAAAGGYAGTPYHEERQAELAKSLMDSDFDRYLQNIMGIQNRGLEGVQGYANTGYTANKELNDILANVLQQKAGLAFEGVNSRNQRFSDLLKAGASGLGAYYGAK